LKKDLIGDFFFHWQLMLVIIGTDYSIIFTNFNAVMWTLPWTTLTEIIISWKLLIKSNPGVRDFAHRLWIEPSSPSSQSDAITITPQWWGEILDFLFRVCLEHIALQIMMVLTTSCFFKAENEIKDEFS